MDKGEMVEYDLIGIVVHRGSGAKAGHYHAYIRDMNNEAIWKPVKRRKIKRNKRRNNRRSNRNADKSQRVRDKKEKAVAILVSILSEHEQQTKNQLNLKFTRMNNLTPWSCTYQRDLGPFGDFLKNNHRFRILNDTRNFTVCLANDADFYHDNGDDNYINLASDTDEDMTSHKGKGRGKGKGKGNKSNKKKNKNDLDGFIVGDGEEIDEEYDVDEDHDGDEDEDLYQSSATPPSANKNERRIRGSKQQKSTKSRTNKKSPKSPASPDLNEEGKDDEKYDNNKCDKNAAHWFDFNDEDITAVFDTEIDDLYDGGDEECPYMVIYRRKCMNSTNFPPEIPLYVEALLIDEPLDAEEDKQDLTITIIRLNVC